MYEVERIIKSLDRYKKNQFLIEQIKYNIIINFIKIIYLNFIVGMPTIKKIVLIFSCNLIFFYIF